VPGRPPLHPATDAHPTAAGNRLIADEIVAHIRARGLE
jgi:phospholipase/lecithinase/hemolysin